MARPRELLSLVDIADETGISYATLRNYALKYSDEIPSEGSGRSTRYPRSAVKVFQRLRKESKPGRKPKSASEAVARPLAPVLAAPVLVPVRQEAPAAREIPAPAPRQAATDTSGMERELAAIRGFLERIAGSLEQLASERVPRNVPSVPEPDRTPAPVAEAKPEASAPVAPALLAPVPLAPVPAPVAPERDKNAIPLPPIDMRGGQERGGHRRLHSLPKVMGQRGKRPE